MNHAEKKRDDTPERDRWMPKMVSDTFSSWAMERFKRFQWQGTEFDQDTWKFGTVSNKPDAERAREVVKVLLNYLRIEYER